MQQWLLSHSCYNVATVLPPVRGASTPSSRELMSSDAGLHRASSYRDLGHIAGATAGQRRPGRSGCTVPAAAAGGVPRAAKPVRVCHGASGAQQAVHTRLQGQQRPDNQCPRCLLTALSANPSSCVRPKWQTSMSLHLFHVSRTPWICTIKVGYFGATIERALHSILLIGLGVVAGSDSSIVQLWPFLRPAARCACC